MSAAVLPWRAPPYRPAPLVALGGSGALVAGAALGAPVVVLGAFLVVILAIAVYRWPSAALVAFFALVPFHHLGYDALTFRGHLGAGPLTLWKDVLLVALLGRGVIDRVRKDGLALPRSSGDLYIVGYVLVLAVLASLSPDLHVAGYGFAVDAEGPLLLLAVVALAPSRRVVRACLLAILGVATVMAAGALIEQYYRAAFPMWFGHSPTSEVYYADPGRQTGYRSGSFMGDSLVLGFYLSAAVGVVVAIVAMSRGLSRKLALAALLVCLGGTVVTYTRSAYAGAGMALIVATALCPARRTVRLALVGIFVTAAATAAFGWAQSGDERIFHFVDNDEHIQLLRNDVELIARNPLGYGVGTTDTVARRFNLNAIDQQVDNVSIGPSAESVFLGRAVEGGALGMVMFLVLLFWTGMRLRAARLRSLEAADREGAAAAAGALGALIGVSVAGLLLPTQDLSISTAVWGAAGCALVMTGERAFSTAPRWTLAHLLGRAASRPA